MHRSVISRVRPHLKWINQARYLRPTVQIAKDRFQLCIDVRGFCRDEIQIRARPECVVIEGKQERRYKNSCVIRQFVRKFRLPEDCKPSKVESRLSDCGILTVIAHRGTRGPSDPTERNLPINYCGPNKLDDACVMGGDCCVETEPCEVKIEVSGDIKPCDPPGHDPKKPPSSSSPGHPTQ